MHAAGLKAAGLTANNDDDGVALGGDEDLDQQGQQSNEKKAAVLSDKSTLAPSDTAEWKDDDVWGDDVWGSGPAAVQDCTEVATGPPLVTSLSESKVNHSP